jgi:Tfp pilus assembly protein PilF
VVVMNKKFLISIASVLLLACCFAALAVYVLAKRKAPRTAEQFYARGAMRFNQKDYANAYQLFTTAVQKNPTNAMYCREAARAAALQGRSAEAQLYAQKAWDHGLKEAELWKFIVGSYSPIDKTNALAVGLRLLEELPKVEERAELRGDIFYLFSEPTNAFQAWQAALLSHPTNAQLLIKMAKLHLQRKEIEQARDLLEQHQSRAILSESASASWPSFTSPRKTTRKPWRSSKRPSNKVNTATGSPWNTRCSISSTNESMRPARFSSRSSPSPSRKRGRVLSIREIRIFLGYSLAKNDRKAILDLLSLISEKLPPARERMRAGLSAGFVADPR